MSLLTALFAQPALILRHRNIFLLSHMRANTSLFGHLLGSHPQIEGYYEMHIGYYSWRSLWRQKQIYFSRHEAKRGAKYMFDKVLHDGHAVNPVLLQRQDCRTVMMLRSPAQSIKSLIALYRQSHPSLPEATAEGATRYYVDRLATLADIAGAISDRYYYLDAECLVESTASTLADLGSWLDLESPIPFEYQTFSNTGLNHAGDTSARLKSGKISRDSRDYAEIELAPALLEVATAAYGRHRATLVQLSNDRSLCEHVATDLQG
jgi:hypothetical protein